MRALAIVTVLLGAATGQTTEYKDGDTVLEGFIVAPEKDGKHPGVLIVHQWVGLTDFEKNKAAELAKLGYVAFAVDIYGKGVRAKSPQEAGQLAGTYRNGDRMNYRARLKAALDALRKHEKVDPNRIGAIGFCFGGTGVLELARMGADVKGVVSFHGGLSATKPEEARNIQCKVLALHGAIDPLVPDEEVAGFMKEMRDAKVDFQFVAYGGAVHSFTNPKANWDVAKYHPDAARRSWIAMKNFFEECFAG